MKKNILFVFVMMISLGATARQTTEIDSLSPPIKKLHKKGDFYFTWGYDRSWYNKSDIRFLGPGYNFTLHDVVAEDRPTPFGIRYLDPEWLSIPQFNFRFGYYINDKYSISIGWDHMRYVVTVPQQVTISGYIGPTISDPPISTNIASGNYEGTYDNTPFEIKPDFLTFEHCNGLNFVSVDLERHDVLWQPKKLSNMGLSLMTGLAVGPVVPRSQVTLFGVGGSHYWHITGVGAALKVGLDFDILRWLFFRTDFKMGCLNLTKIPTTGQSVDVAKQNIVFYENSWLLGFKF